MSPRGRWSVLVWLELELGVREMLEIFVLVCDRAENQSPVAKSTASVSAASLWHPCPPEPWPGGNTDVFPTPNFGFLPFI